MCIRDSLSISHCWDVNLGPSRCPRKCLTTTPRWTNPYLSHCVEFVAVVIHTVYSPVLKYFTLRGALFVATPERGRVECVVVPIGWMIYSPQEQFSRFAFSPSWRGRQTLTRTSARAQVHIPAAVS